MDAYSEKVMDHFMHPRNVGEIPDANGVGNVGNPICVSPETIILTNSNAREIKEVEKGNLVLSHDGKYHKVEIVHNRPYKGKIYSLIINNLGNTLLTPEHHILALKLGKRDKFKLYKRFKPDWYSAEELRKGDVVLYPIPKETKDKKEINLDVGKSKWDLKSKELPQKIKIDNDFCRLVGYYLAEGYVRTDKCKATIGFVFGSEEKSYIQDVLNLMKKIFDVRPTKLMHFHSGTAVDIPFYSAHLARFFERQFGKGAKNKRLPHWMLKLPLEKQKALLCGLWRGDGYVDLKRQRAKYVTISKQLAYQLRLLLLRQKIISNFSLGKAYGIHKKSYLLYIQDDDSLKKIIKITQLKNIKIEPKRLNIHKSWLDKNFYYTTIRKISPIEYKGLVYNLEVKNTYSYVSDALTLHNCGDVMRMYIKVENDIIVDAKFKTFGCLPPNEEIVLKKGGWEKISNLSYGMTVINGEGKETQIVETYKRNYTGKLYRIIPFVSPFNSFSVTPQHPIFCIKREWIKAVTRNPRCDWLRFKEEDLFLRDPDFVKAYELSEGDYLIFNVNREVKDNALFTQDLMRLIGYYLWEGYITAQGSVVAFAFNRKEKKLISEVKTLLQNVIGKKPKSRIRDNVIEVYICSRKLARFLMFHCKKIARSKSLSEDVLLLPFSKQWQMIKTFLSGGGDNYRRRPHNSKTYRIITTSELLAIQMQEILARGGIFASVRKIPKTDCYIGERKLKDSIQYLISFKLVRDDKFVHYNGKYFFVPIKRINIENYKGPVHNFQVYNEPNSYLVRGFAVHNCGAAIATSSMITEMVKGKTIEEALEISNKTVAEALGGLPPIKLHCSVLAEEALKAAIEDYRNRTSHNKETNI